MGSIFRGPPTGVTIEYYPIQRPGPARGAHAPFCGWQTHHLRRVCVGARGAQPPKTAGFGAGIHGNDIERWVGRLTRRGSVGQRST